MLKNVLQPTISFVIPIYNEADYLNSQVEKLFSAINILKIQTYEIILVENGSKDKTLAIAQALSKNNSKIKVLSLRKPGYGQAVKKGIAHAKNEIIVQLDLDLIDSEFIKQSIQLNDNYNILVGSKFLTQDQRSIVRKTLSAGLKLVLNYCFGYKGTDTHGIKAYQRDVVQKFIDQVPVTLHFFDTSLLILAQKNGYHIREVPVVVREIRPSRFPSIKRSLQALREIFYLIYLSRQTQFNQIKLAVIKLRSIIL